jgi:anti-sigma regulatory factor (Ser/Thr protein kinase)
MELLRCSFAHGELPGPLRRSARSVLESRCPADRVEDAVVVISELVQNVTQHTAGGGDLVLREENAAIVIEVRDGDPAPPRPQPPDGHRPGGRGLLLVAGMTRRWGVRPDARGKVVWAEIAVAADPPAAAA